MKFNFKLSRPALIALVAYFIMALIILLLLLLIPIALSVYSVNCMIVGNCWIWSYCNAILIAAYVILFSVVTLIDKR